MSPESFAVLIAAGDPAMRQLMRNSLMATGFQLAEAPATQAALAMLGERRFDLVLVDLNVPDRGGIDACRRLRAQAPSLGIIAVRAGGTAEDEARVLEAGADDCVAAPFRYREIVARMVAVLRRVPVAGAKLPARLRAGKLEVDLKRRLFRRAGRIVHLSPREFDLLVVLMTNAGSAVTHTKLVRSAWGDGALHNRAYLRTYIQSLRNKLEDDPAHPEYIVTQPWVGYRFAARLDGIAGL